MPKAKQEHHEENLGLERLVFFSDAVIAIAITLLVLEIKAPDIEKELVPTELTQQILALWPKYLGYLTSFWVIAFYWMAHHRMFRYIKAYDQGLLMLNMISLFFIAFMPFPTALLFQYPAQWITVVVYAATIALIGLSMVSLWLYATREHRLVDKTLDVRFIRLSTTSLLATPAVFLLSIALAFVNPEWAMYSWLILLPLYFLFRPVRHPPGH